MSAPPCTIVITGPESSGKSTLALDLSMHFNSMFSGEYSREFLEQLDRPYTKEDVIEIAKRQMIIHHAFLTHSKSIAIFDTGLLVLKIWILEKYNTTVPWIEVELQKQHPNELYLLCKPDIPWAQDPLRENEYDRDRLFGIYEEQLKAYGKNFVVISGSQEERVRLAIGAVAL